MARFRSMYMDWPALFSDCLGLSVEARGAYVWILGSMWLNGGRLYDDPELLRKVASVNAHSWHNVWREIEGKFERRDGFIYQKRLTATYLRALEKSEKSQLAAHKRWHDPGSMRTHMRSQSGRNAFAMPINNKNKNSTDSPDDVTATRVPTEPASDTANAAPPESGLPTEGGNGRTEIGSAELAAILKAKEGKQR